MGEFKPYFEERKYYLGEGMSEPSAMVDSGAFPRGVSVRFELAARDNIYIYEVIFHIKSEADGMEQTARAEYMGSDGGMSLFDFKVGDGGGISLLECGLYYCFYEIRTERGVLYYSGEDPRELQPHSGAGRQLLIYEPDFQTPDFLRGGMIYHIFVDRFRSSGRYPLREGASLNTDWDSGIPMYAPKRGAPLKNNEFFGGDLTGITEKLGYLRSLGTTVIYLSPIFDSPSNHKYDTADYMKVDSMFGGDEAFSVLCREAGKLGIKIILDGVFNHTGDDSVYFNRYSRYGAGGAFNSRESEYYRWYSFESYPDKYECWWGIPILPRVNCDDPGYRSFILGEGGVIRKYMRLGASGFRLDVADELSDDFIASLRKTVREENPSGAVIGEVWEDASNKCAYGVRRGYLLGAELDSVMNYPLREALIGYIKHGEAARLRKVAEGIYRRYPRCVCDCLMNFLGTHDTERILTVLGGASSCGKSENELARMRIPTESLPEARKMLICAFTALFTFYGVPSVFYGDEAGIQGYHDPFCRAPFPWNAPDCILTEAVSALGRIRSSEQVFKSGEFSISELTGELFCFDRMSGGELLRTVISRTRSGEYRPGFGFKLLYKNGRECSEAKARESLTLSPYSAFLIKRIKTER